MIKIDTTDSLYKFLKSVGGEDIEKDYVELASNGRHSIKDIRLYLKSKFDLSQVNDIEESELIKILDYYTDIKKIKRISKKELKKLIEMYLETNDDNIKEIIINSKLKDVLYMCLNYYTLHKNVDIADLVQVANIGIINALNHYSKNNKVDFDDCILYWTRLEIIKEFEEKK